MCIRDSPTLIRRGSFSSTPDVGYLHAEQTHSSTTHKKGEHCCFYAFYCALYPSFRESHALYHKLHETPFHLIMRLAYIKLCSQPPSLLSSFFFKKWKISNVASTLSIINLPGTKADCFSLLSNTSFKRLVKTFKTSLYEILQKDIGRRSFIEDGYLVIRMRETMV